MSLAVPGLRAEVRRLRAEVAELTAAAGAAPPTGRPFASSPPGTDGAWPFPVGAGVTRTEAMAVPTLAYIRNGLAGGLSSMDLDRYPFDPATGDADTSRELPPGWLLEPDPNPNIPSPVFWSWVVDDLFFNGVSTLVVLARDWTGFPAQVRRVLPGQLWYDPTASAWGMNLTAEIFYRGHPIDPADVKVISGPHEGICNYGGALIRAALDLEAAAATSAAEPVPNVELHQTTGEPLPPDKATELVSDWAAARRNGATAYTPANIETKGLGFSSAELQLVEARQYMATQLARLAGVNPVLVSAAMGSASSYVYTNQGDYRQAFLDDVLDPYLAAIERRLSANDLTPRGQCVRFDRDAFTHPTLMEKAQIMVGALRWQADPALLDRLGQALGIDLSPAAAPPKPAPAPTPAPAPAPAAPIPQGVPA